MINNFTDPVTMLQQFKGFEKQIDFKEHKDTDKTQRYWYDNRWFCHSDGIFYSCILNEFRPKRIIEIGSGFSSAVLLDMVDKIDLWEPSVTFIEPNPARLYSLLSDHDKEIHTIVESNLQDVDYSIFSQLNSNDLLFVDSSHYYEPGSDVYDLLHNILPNLNRGVIVHFHDIFYPECTYPSDWHNRKYTEMPALFDFLETNSEWKTILSTRYTVKLYTEEIKEYLSEHLASMCQKKPGGSIYIQKS